LVLHYSCFFIAAKIRFWFVESIEKYNFGILKILKINMGNITFVMIKPCAVSHEHIGEILSIINKAGFHFVSIKMLHISKSQAEKFYAVHAEKSFYKDLVEFMSSGPIVAAILQKENAVNDFRKLIGNTNPANADEGTIRKMFATSVQENAVHGSDSDENAVIESNFFFSQIERFYR